jgi:DnaJ-class molecular chaperone
VSAANPSQDPQRVAERARRRYWPADSQGRGWGMETCPVCEGAGELADEEILFPVTCIVCGGGGAVPSHKPAL